MFQLAFDESGTHDKQLLSVAAYIAPSDQWERFSREWYDALPSELRPFHAKKFFAWARGHRPESDQIRDQLWGAIRRRVNRGFSVSMSVESYEGIVGPRLRSDYGAAYTMCVQECLLQIQEWADRHGHNEPFAYFFEAGHSNAGQLDKHMNLLKANPVSKGEYRIGSITFPGKSNFIPLQAADMLVHQVNRFLRSDRRSQPLPVYEQWFRETLPEHPTLLGEQQIRQMVESM